MSIELECYRELLGQLDAIRKQNDVEDSPEERAHLDKMNVAWHSLSKADLKELQEDLQENLPRDLQEVSSALRTLVLRVNFIVHHPFLASALLMAYSHGMGQYDGPRLDLRRFAALVGLPEPLPEPDYDQTYEDWMDRWDGQEN